MTDDMPLQNDGFEAVTVGVTNFGVGESQYQTNIPHVRVARDVVFNVTEASNANAPIDGRHQRLQVLETINWIAIAPSARGADVHVSLGRDVQVLQLPAATGNYFPLGDYQAHANAGTMFYPLPTARNYDFDVFIQPPSGYAAPFADVVRILYGYLPDQAERVAITSQPGE